MGNNAYVNVKVNKTWRQLPADTPDSMIEASAYRIGTALYDEFEVPEGDDLWRECDDGHGDELIRDIDEAANTITLWDGDRFYTCSRNINAS